MLCWSLDGGADARCAGRVVQSTTSTARTPRTRRTPAIILPTRSGSRYSRTSTTRTASSAFPRTFKWSRPCVLASLCVVPRAWRANCWIFETFRTTLLIVILVPAVLSVRSYAALSFPRHRCPCTILTPNVHSIRETGQRQQGHVHRSLSRRGALEMSDLPFGASEEKLSPKP